MKKVLAITTLLLGSSVALAQYSGPATDAPTHGGYKGPTSIENPTTVAMAKQMRDDSYVRLRGKITRHINKDKYMFADETGEIVIEIDDKKWRGLSVSDSDVVEIVGEVDKDWNSVEVEVDYITKVQ